MRNRPKPPVDSPTDADLITDWDNGETEKVVAVLDDPKYAEGLAFGLKGGTGVTMLEEAAA